MLALQLKGATQNLSCIEYVYTTQTLSCIFQQQETPLSIFATTKGFPIAQTKLHKATK